MERELQRLIDRLRVTGFTVATAESCTGGWLAKVLTDQPGASHWFLGGWVVYSNAAKERELGVPQTVLRRHGAVSHETVLALAREARRRSGATLAVAISGIAGPGGAVAGKPVGTVCFGFARRSGRGARVTSVTRRFPGDRDAVRAAAVRFALKSLYSMARD